jgi:hypothetical protein
MGDARAVNRRRWMADARALTRRRWMGDVVAVVAYSAIAFFAYVHLWLAGGPAAVSGTTSDPVGSMWYLAYTPFALLHGHNPFYTTYGNAPYGLNLLDNTSSGALGALLTPVTVLFGPDRAYVTGLTISLIVSAAAAYALLRRWVGRAPAFAGGLLYGFSPYMVGQGAEHLNLLFVPVVPVMFMLLDELLVQRRHRPELVGVVIGLVAAFQFFVSTEVLATSAVMSAIGLALCGVFQREQWREALPLLVRGAAAASAVAVVLLAYPAWVDFAGPDHLNGPLQTQPQAYRADLAALIVPSHLQILAPASATRISRHFVDNGLGENGAYLGVPLLLVSGWATARLWRRRTIARLSASLLIVSVILSLGARLQIAGFPDAHPSHELPLPGAVLAHLGPLGNITPVRFSLYTALMAAVLLALLIDHVLAARRFGWLAPAALAVIALVPLIPPLPYGEQSIDVPAFFTTAAVHTVAARSTALLYPFPGWSVDDSAPMLWQAESGMRFRIVGGYFFVPDGTGATTIGRPSVTKAALDSLYRGIRPPETPAGRQAEQAELRSWGVTVVLADRSAPSGAAAVSYLQWLLGRPPRIEGRMAIWTGL